MAWKHFTSAWDGVWLLTVLVVRGLVDGLKDKVVEVESVVRQNRLLANQGAGSYAAS